MGTRALYAYLLVFQVLSSFRFQFQHCITQFCSAFEIERFRRFFHFLLEQCDKLHAVFFFEFLAFDRFADILFRFFRRFCCTDDVADFFLYGDRRNAVFFIISCLNRAAAGRLIDRFLHRVRNPVCIHDDVAVLVPRSASIV